MNLSLQYIIKLGKHNLAKLVNFVYFCITRGDLISMQLMPLGISFPRVMQKYTKIVNFGRLYFPLNFTTRLRNFTKYYKILFQTVMKYKVLPIR